MLVEPSSLKAADLPILHDAELYLILMDRDASSLQLSFKNSSKAIYKFIFNNILTYKINNVQYQNVVSRVLVSKSGIQFGGDLEDVVRWTCSGSSNDLLISTDNLRAHVAEIRSGGLELFYVDPSWGAEVGVIAKSISMFYEN